MFETCQRQGKRILNPIIDWTTSEVWEFLNYYGCESNPLYQCGYDRIGCIGCPMAGKKRIKQFNDYPKYRNNYIRAFDRMLKINTDVNYNWKTGEDVFDWWMNGKSMPKRIEGQLSLLTDY